MLVYWLPLGVLGNKRGKERKLLNKQFGAIYKKNEKNEKKESPDEQVLILPSTSTRDHILQTIVDDR